MSKKNSKQLVLDWVPPILWMCCIFYVSSIPGAQLQVSENSDIDFFTKTLAHAIEYFILTVLVIRTLRQRGTKSVYLHALVISLIFAISDEYHQSFVPNRESSLYDIMIDTIGISLGIFFYYSKSNLKQYSKIIQNKLTQ